MKIIPMVYSIRTRFDKTVICLYVFNALEASNAYDASNVFDAPEHRFVTNLVRYFIGAEICYKLT